MPEHVRPPSKGHIGRIVAGSMLTGLILALFLTIIVFGGATEPIISGSVLLAFVVGHLSLRHIALGWVMLA